MSELNVTNTISITELQSQFLILDTQLTELQRNHKNLLDKYLEKEKESEGLITTIEALSKKSAFLDEITRNNEELNEEIKKLKKVEKKYQELIAKKNGIEEKNTQLEKNLGLITQELEELDRDRALLHEANTELSRDYEDISKNISKLEEDKKNLLYQLGGSQVKTQNMESLKQELEELRGSKNRMVIENDKLNTQISMLQQKVTEKDSLLKDHTHQLSALETVLQEIKTQNLSLQETKEKEIAYRADNLQLQSQISDLQHEKDILEKHTQELLQRGGVWETENARLMDEISTLQNIIQKLDK